MRAHISSHFYSSLSQQNQIAEKEWKLFLSNTAWERVEPTLTDKVKATYLMLLKGKSLESVAEELQIQKNTVYVYKLRVTYLSSNLIKFGHEQPPSSMCKSLDGIKYIPKCVASSYFSDLNTITS